jgi:hypothetical protein
MAEPSTTNDHERNDEADQTNGREVTAGIDIPKTAPQASGEPNPLQVATEDLQAGVRRQGLGREAQRKITVDTSPQSRFSLPHWLWPFGLGGCRGTTSTNHAERPSFKRKGDTSDRGVAFSASGFCHIGASSAREHKSTLSR